MSRQMTWLMKVGEKMMLHVLGQHGLVGGCLRKRVSTEVVRPCGRMDMVRRQASEVVLNRAWQSAASRWVEYVWWRRGQPRMQHPLELAHIIRQQGLGDRVA